MTTDRDTYAMLDTRDWPQSQVVVSSTRNGHRQPRRPRLHQEEIQHGDLSLKSLNKDWHGVIRNIGSIGLVILLS